MLHWLRADLSKQYPALHEAVLRIQCLEDPKKNGTPLSGESRWEGDTLFLKHDAEDEAAGVEPFIAPLCLSRICHSNVSEIRNTADVAAYMNADLPSAWVD